ncbi:MAG: Rrf2 family transcriptional regulator [Capsulimonadaceae bacterium]|nr:Rrf2 family transcriptional regulator [Capsulimonadaceae bacterium]
MISQTTEYALRASVYLAENPDVSKTIHQIAEASSSPSGYLSKVMQDLVRAGIVRSQRGPGGGFVLARACSVITLYEVVQAVDPISRITHCPLERPEHASQLCLLHQRLDDAARLVEESFRSTTLADVMTQPLFAPGES